MNGKEKNKTLVEIYTKNGSRIRLKRYNMEHRGKKWEKDTKLNVNKNKNVQRETYKYESRRKQLCIHKIRGPEEDNMNNGEQISKIYFKKTFLE